jgi:RimJ/RimL family protein N-acetyltransferase
VRSLTVRKTQLHLPHSRQIRIHIAALSKGRYRIGTIGRSVCDSLASLCMAPVNPVLIDVPVPIRTPRLLLRPKQVGDGAITAAAVHETWDELHKWMRWAENPADFTAESMEIRTRRVMASFILREGIELTGVEVATGTAVIWCGLHDIDWQGRQCDTGYWVRKSAQGKGIATEAANALVRYAFGALGMRRIGLTHSAGNEASRRIAEKLGFSFEGIQRGANILPGGENADRLCYARLNVAGLPDLEVQWPGK